MKWMALSFVLLSSSAMADITTYKGFDFSKCRRWIITNDVVDSEKPDQLRKLRGDDWTAFVAENYEDESTVLGACRFSTEGIWSCPVIRGHEKFPLSGASYKFDEVTLAWKCTEGCAKVRVQEFYELPYEGGDEPDPEEIAYEKALDRFKKACPNARKLEF